MEYIKNIMDVITSSLESFGLVGGFVLILLESVIPILPLGIFIGFNALAFGTLLGFFISYLATVVGCLLSFLLFRSIVRKWFYKLFRDKKKKEIEEWMEKLYKMRLTTLTVILSMPFTPAFLVNIAAGLANYNLKKFLIAILISKITIIYFWGYVGTSLLESVTSPIVLVKVGIIMLLAYIISKIIQKLIEKGEMRNV